MLFLLTENIDIFLFKISLKIEKNSLMCHIIFCNFQSLYRCSGLCVRPIWCHLRRQSTLTTRIELYWWRFYVFFVDWKYRDFFSLKRKFLLYVTSFFSNFNRYINVLVFVCDQYGVIKDDNIPWILILSVVDGHFMFFLLTENINIFLFKISL